MRRIIIFVAILCWAVGADCQDDDISLLPTIMQTSNAPIVENDSGYVCNGETINADQLIAYLKDNCPAAYSEFDRYATSYYRNSITAGVLTGTSIVPLAVGILYLKNGDALIGGLLMGLTGSLLVASVPCWVVATKKKKQAIPMALDVYNSQCVESTTYSSTLNFKLNLSATSFGLTMTF